MIRNLQIVFLTLICTTFSFGQNWDDSCEEAITRANSDFESGIMKATSYGFIIAEDFYFEDFYDNYLKENYGIDASNGGCVISESTGCYSSRMFELIKQKFGKNFFKKARKEAEKLYVPNKEQFIEDYPSNKLEQDAYTVVDIRPEYPGGIKQLFEFVADKIKNESIANDDIYTRVFISFVIDSVGRPTKMKTIRSFDVQLEEVIVRILKEMPNWKPGVLNNKHVDVQIILPFEY